MQDFILHRRVGSNFVLTRTLYALLPLLSIIIPPEAPPRRGGEGADKTQ
jgi:hypothetical protein